MAKIEGVSQFDVNNYPDQSEWIGGLFDPLNKILGSMSNALRGKLTFVENIYSQKFIYTFKHNIELDITFNLPSFNGILVTSCNDFFKFKVVKKNNSKFGLTFQFDDASTHEVTFIVLG